MKKMVLSFVGMMSLTAQAQVVNFEDVTLAVDTFYNGTQDNLQGYSSNGIFFPTDTAQYSWGYSWDGIACSNKTDVTTPGLDNEFSAFAGIGATSSAKYGVVYDGNIDFGSEKTMLSIDVTNTTYAALSMRDGDSYGKIFGSNFAADGMTVDGTNGNDFFILQVIGLKADLSIVDTIEFALADFRLADSLDYILDTWETINLSSFGNIRFLNFKLISSDNANFGGTLYMNTPNYFAIDNIKYGNVSLGNNEITKINAYPNPTTGMISFGNLNEMIHIYSTDGKCVFEGQLEANQAINLSSLPKGNYTYLIETNVPSRGKIVLF